jgi:hypothetical protein
MEFKVASSKDFLNYITEELQDMDIIKSKRNNIIEV